jgi:methionyl-tRNA formyltransferase
MSISFAFLVLKEHPYGQEMLRILLARGFVPGLIVEEVSGVADEERRKFLTRIAGQARPPAIAELVKGLDIAHHEVDDHNGPLCRAILEAFGPELVVLGGTGILRPPILSIPSLGTVNAHPGLLPQLRGSSSVGWALYKDYPVGSTTHYVERGIDTGPIILQRRLPVYRGDSYERLVRRVLTLSGELMAETVALFETGEVRSTPQDREVGETLRVIPEALLAQAKAHLAQGRYSHFENGKGRGK